MKKNANTSNKSKNMKTNWNFTEKQEDDFLIIDKKDEEQNNFIFDEWEFSTEELYRKKIYDEPWLKNNMYLNEYIFSKKIFF